MVNISTSTKINGSMKSTSGDFALSQTNRTRFLDAHAIHAANTTLVHIRYEGDDYCRYQTIDETYKGDGIVRNSTLTVDALVVTQSNHALLLPLADCIGAVLHDPVQNILMVSHLGRHNLEQNSGAESVNYLARRHHVQPHNLKVWLSPAAGKQNYPLLAFNNRGLHEVAVEQLMTAGVTRHNIDVSLIDTTIDQNYFSHSEFLKGHRKIDGRHCIVAIMK